MSQPNQDFDRTEVLKNVVLFTLSGIHLWSGRKRMREEDYGGANLPPETLVSLGSKRTISPESLRIFENLKRRAQEACSENGTRFLSGWAVPRDKAKALNKLLAAIQTEFNDEKSKFIRDYDKTIEDWIKANAQYAQMLRKAVTSVTDVQSKMSFGWEACAVTPTNDPDLDGNLGNAVSNLSNGLFGEIAAFAKETLDKSLMGREKVNRRFLSPIKRMRGKLSGLAFIDPVVRPIVETIDKVLASISQEGPLEGRDLAAVTGLLHLVADPDRMRAHAQGLLKGEEVDLFDDTATDSEEVDLTSAVSAMTQAAIPDFTGQAVAAQPAVSMSVKSFVPSWQLTSPVAPKPVPTVGVRQKQSDLPEVESQVKAHVDLCKQMLAPKPQLRTVSF